MDTTALLMLLADARLPVAGHTQSGGLEAAIVDGLTADLVPAFIAARLRTVTMVEAGTAMAGRVAAGTAMTGQVAADPMAGVAAVTAAWAARTPSPALRRNSRMQGRAVVRLARALWPGSAALATLAAGEHPPRPVALGAVAATAGLSPRELALLIGYDDIQTVTSAALKLLPIAPEQATSWTVQALQRLDALVEATVTITRPDQIPAPSAPQLEGWAEAHSHASRRLFSA